MILLGVVVILFVIVLVWFLFQHSPRPTEISKKLTAMLNEIYPEEKNFVMSEGSSSYTEGKRIITICTKSPRTGQVYDWNTLLYVSLHELAHVITKRTERNSTGKVIEHGPLFENNFRMLLARADSLGMYNPRLKIPEDYCKP